MPQIRCSCLFISPNFSATPQSSMRSTIRPHPFSSSFRLEKMPILSYILENHITDCTSYHRLRVRQQLAGYSLRRSRDILLVSRQKESHDTIILASDTAGCLCTTLKTDLIQLEGYLSSARNENAGTLRHSLLVPPAPFRGA